jgi:hypothetical protein
MLYFLLHDAQEFHQRISPALGTSWRRRTFGPIVELADQLKPTITAFAEHFRLTADEQPFLARLSADQPFDRRLWRHLAGEVLLYAAADAPTVQTAEATLALLMSADQREIIRQAHAGSSDLEFDGIPYRPGHAGFNDTSDVTRLADELGRIDPATWKPADLTTETDDPSEELAFAFACLAALRELYTTARNHGQVVICEDI